MRLVRFRRNNNLYRFFVDDPSIEERMIKNRNFYEFYLLEAIRDKYGIRGGTWIDAGANFGNHSVFFSELANKVIAYEPVEYNYKILERNIRLNNKRNIIAKKLGLGQDTYKAKFKFGGVGRWSQCVLVPDAMGDISVTSLDLETIPDVKLIKADVEGAEMDFIRGSLNTIVKHRPEIFIESWHREHISRMLELLPGYKIIERFEEAPVYFLSPSDYEVTFTE